MPGMTPPLPASLAVIGPLFTAPPLRAFCSMALNPFAGCFGKFILLVGSAYRTEIGPG